MGSAMGILKRETVGGFLSLLKGSVFSFPQSIEFFYQLKNTTSKRIRTLELLIFFVCFSSLYDIILMIGIIPFVEGEKRWLLVFPFFYGIFCSFALIILMFLPCFKKYPLFHMFHPFFVHMFLFSHSYIYCVFYPAVVFFRGNLMTVCGFILFWYVPMLGQLFLILQYFIFSAFYLFLSDYPKPFVVLQSVYVLFIYSILYVSIDGMQKDDRKSFLIGFYHLFQMKRIENKMNINQILLSIILPRSVIKQLKTRNFDSSSSFNHLLNHHPVLKSIIFQERRKKEDEDDEQNNEDDENIKNEERESEKNNNDEDSRDKNVVISSTSAPTTEVIILVQQKEDKTQAEEEIDEDGSQTQTQEETDEDESTNTLEITRKDKNYFLKFIEDDSFYYVRSYENVTINFLKIHDFDKLLTYLNGIELVSLLNTFFSDFDELLLSSFSTNDIEKENETPSYFYRFKTVNQYYMYSCGFPLEHNRHDDDDEQKEEIEMERIDDNEEDDEEEDQSSKSFFLYESIKKGFEIFERINQQQQSRNMAYFYKEDRVKDSPERTFEENEQKHQRVKKVNISIGTSLGTVVAGVVGFFPTFDCWSDSTNVAARMSQTNQNPYSIQMDEECFEALKNGQKNETLFEVVDKKEGIEIKGRGKMNVYQIKQTSSSSPPPEKTMKDRSSSFFEKKRKKRRNTCSSFNSSNSNSTTTSSGTSSISSSSIFSDSISKSSLMNGSSTSINSNFYNSSNSFDDDQRFQLSSHSSSSFDHEDLMEMNKKGKISSKKKEKNSLFRLLSLVYQHQASNEMKLYHQLLSFKNGRLLRYVKQHANSYFMNSMEQKKEINERKNIFLEKDNIFWRYCFLFKVKKLFIWWIRCLPFQYYKYNRLIILFFFFSSLISSFLLDFIRVYYSSMGVETSFLDLEKIEERVHATSFSTRDTLTIFDIIIIKFMIGIPVFLVSTFSYFFVLPLLIEKLKNRSPSLSLALFYLLSLLFVFIGFSFNCYFFYSYFERISDSNCIHYYILLLFLYCLGGVPFLLRSSLMILSFILFFLVNLIFKHQQDDLFVIVPNLLPYFVGLLLMIQYSYVHQVDELSDFYMVFELRRRKKIFEEQKEFSNSLLNSILPENMIDVLKLNQNEEEEEQQERDNKSFLNPLKTIIKGKFMEEICILFADAFHFTSFVHNRCNNNPFELIYNLNLIFSSFDLLTTQYQNITRIKLIGDCYECVTISNSKENPYSMSCFSLDMMKIIEHLDIIDFRIGIHLGSGFTGIVGKTKFAFDVFGKSIQVAESYENTSKRMKIHVSKEFRNSTSHLQRKAKEKYLFRKRKNRNSYWLVPNVRQRKSINE